MRLHSAALEHVGRFGTQVTLGPLSDQLNIIAATNEAGKSTLIRGIARGLFDRHTCKDQEIRTLQPVGTDLPPQIEVDFSTGAGRFRISKQFLVTPRSLLQEWNGDEWRTLAEGDLADQRVRHLLQSSQPGRGATTAAHWGMLGYLWAHQGEPATWPDWSQASGEAIRSRLVRVSLDPMVDGLCQRLWKHYTESFTPGGQPKKGGVLHDILEEAGECEGILEELRQAQEDLSERSDRFRRLSEERQRLEGEVREQESLAKAARETAQQAEVKTAERQARQSEMEGARQRLKQVQDDLDSIKTAQAQRDQIQRRRRSLIERMTEWNHQRVRLRSEGEALEHERAGAKRDRKRERTKRDELRKTIAWTRLRNEVSDLERLLNQTAATRTQIESLRQSLGGLASLKAKPVKALEALERQIQALTLRLETQGLEITIEAEAEEEIEVEGVGGAERLPLKAGVPRRISTPQYVRLRLKGWGEISVRSGSSEVTELVKQLESAENDLQQQLGKLGVASIEAAREGLIRRKELKAELNTLEASLASSLDRFASIQAVEEAHSQSQRRLAEMESELGESSRESSSSLVEWEAIEAELVARLGEIEAQLEGLDQRLDSLRGDLQKVSEAIGEAERESGELSVLEQHLGERLAEFSDRYPEGVEAEKARSQIAFVETEARLRVVETALPADHESLKDRHRRVGAAAAAVAKRWRDVNAELERLRGSLEAFGGQGLYSRETKLLERLERVRESERRCRGRAWAARLAHDLIGWRKSQATRSVLKPLEDRLSAVFGEITGEPQRRVFLDDQLQILGLGSRENQRVPFRLLSQGAKEQLLLCLRVAVASELAGSEPQVLILDDVLVNTDRQRQERILDLLIEMDPRIQVIVLTCHPEWYRGVGHLITL